MNTKIAHGAVAAVRVTMTVQLAASVTAVALNLVRKRRITMTNWPFPNPPIPWTQKQIKDYAQQQRTQLPESPL